MKNHLIRYKYWAKEEISPAVSQHSIYQQGFRCIYANPVPIASAACLGADVVRDALNTLWLAISDLVKMDKNIDLAFGFANVRFTHRKLDVVFLPSLSKTIGAPEFEHQMVRQTSPVSTRWTTTYGEKWMNSTLGSMIKKPNNSLVNALNDKTKALRLMSLDLSSSGRFFKA